MKLDSRMILQWIKRHTHTGSAQRYTTGSTMYTPSSITQSSGNTSSRHDATPQWTHGTRHNTLTAENL